MRDSVILWEGNTIYEGGLLEGSLNFYRGALRIFDETPDGYKGSPFGVSSEFDLSFLEGIPESFENKIKKQFEYASDIGADWYRAHIPFPYNWGYIEKSDGVFNFVNTDILINQAKENNIQILAQLFPFADWDQVNYNNDEDCMKFEESDNPPVKC